MAVGVVLVILSLTGALMSPVSSPVVHPSTAVAVSRLSFSSTGSMDPTDPTDPTGPTRNKERVAYVPPVDRPVSGGFELESGQYGAGRRGLQYETSLGDRVRAVAAGIVTFAGAVAGRVSITIAHADGRRSTVTGLAEVDVEVGQIVLSGEVIALATPGLLLTLREGDIYIDPGPFLSSPNRTARLVPTRALGSGVSYHYTLPSARSEDRVLLRIAVE